MAQRGLLVVGAGGSGRTTAVRTIVAQAPADVRWVPSSGEDGWDAVADLAERPPAPGTVIAIDDLDALVAALPPEYAREVIDRLERLVRGAGASEILVVASAQRLTGAVARIADLMPRRLVLAAASRAEHIAVGGDPAHYAPGIPPGRGRLDGRAVQVATSADAAPRHVEPGVPWRPHGPLTGFVMRRSPATRSALAEWTALGARVIPIDEFASAAEWTTAAPVVVVGDAEEWQRHWRILSTMRSDQELVVDTSCASEFRMLTGDRSLPPYCEPGLPRAWLLSCGGPPSRIVLPSGTSPRRS